MGRFIAYYIYLIFALIICEHSSYMKDYSELLIMKNYIVYDVANGNLNSFENNRFFVNVGVNNNDTMYEIIMNRNSLFNVKWLKTIKYRGLVG